MATDNTTAAVLTGRQREFLRGNADLGDRGKRAARARIRERLQAAFDDLRLILNSDVDGWQDDVEEVVADVDAGCVWPLPALLFLWTLEHPMFTDREDFAEIMSNPGATVSTSEHMERATTSFDSQVVTGVQAALEFSDLDRVPGDVDNELTVPLGPPVSEMTDEELAELPRSRLDFLFRRGDLGHERYAQVMEIKLDREDSDE
jgi:hypothetical protein